MIYKDLYGLADATTIIRGTYRYRGFQKIVKALFRLGLFSQQLVQLSKENDSSQKGWVSTRYINLLLFILNYFTVIIFLIQGDLIVNLISASEGTSEPIHELLLRQGFDKIEIDMLEQLGMLSRDTPLQMHDSLLETLAAYLTGKLQYGNFCVYFI